jgi:hypothetical protein
LLFDVLPLPAQDCPIALESGVRLAVLHGRRDFALDGNDALIGSFAEDYVAPLGSGPLTEVEGFAYAEVVTIH